MAGEQRRAQQASAMRALIEAGFSPASVVEAVQALDLGKLSHTARFSVQLQPPDVPRPRQEQEFLRTLLSCGYTPDEAERILLRMPPLGEDPPADGAT